MVGSQLDRGCAVDGAAPGPQHGDGAEAQVGSGPNGADPQVVCGLQIMKEEQTVEALHGDRSGQHMGPAHQGFTPIGANHTAEHKGVCPGAGTADMELGAAVD